MKEFKKPEDVLKFCRVLGDPTRMKIIRILLKRRVANLNELAERLKITNGAVTAHIKKLYTEGIIDIEHIPGKRGIQKNCFLKQHRFIIDLSGEYEPKSSYEVSIPVGSYKKYSAMPTCGIATRDAVIGQVDDPRYFDDPKRNEAGILWFTKGFVEYRIPNYLKSSCQVEELQISMEVSSEAPGFCDIWPSEILFFLNGVRIGSFMSPGDFGSVKGLYTPDWWYPYWNQYGLLKLLTVNTEGTFLDAKRISDMTIDQFHITEKDIMDFRLAVTDDSEKIGGMTLFGKGFGNYNQDINVRVIFNRNN